MDKEQPEEGKGGSPTPGEGRKEETCFSVGLLSRGTPRPPPDLLGLPFNGAQLCSEGAG